VLHNGTIWGISSDKKLIHLSLYCKTTIQIYCGLTGSTGSRPDTRAGARWLPPPPSLDVGAPNIQYIAFNKYYLCKQNLDIFQQMLTKAFSSAPTQRIKQTDLSDCYVSSFENDFFEIFKNENDSVDSVISNVLAVSLSIHIIERFVSLSSVIVDQWNVLICLNLLKLRSAVLCIAVIGKLSLDWPQAAFPWASAESFPWGTTSKFCLYFSGCWRCNVNGSSRSDCSILRQ